MFTLDMHVQIISCRKAFVTFLTIMSNILMYVFDMHVQFAFWWEAFVTFVTIVLNIFMYTLDLELLGMGGNHYGTNCIQNILFSFLFWTIASWRIFLMENLSILVCFFSQLDQSWLVKFSNSATNLKAKRHIYFPSLYFQFENSKHYNF